MNMQANILGNLQKDETIAEEKDVLGGSGPLDSDIYPFTIELAYLEKSKGGALGVNLHLKSDTGRNLRQTVYITSGDSKGNKNYYEKNGEKNYLPGFTLIDSLCLLTVGKEIGEVAAGAESKLVKVYSFEAKEEVPTEVPVLMELLGQQVYGAVIKQIEDKNAKGDDGNYHPTGETRESNEIDKFFRARDKMTTAEIRAQAEEAAFFDRWLEKNKGQVKDKTSKTGGTAGAPKPAGTATAKPTKSLFG